MSIKTETDNLIVKMQSLNDVRQAYIAKLNSHDAGLEASADFLDIADTIYNLYCGEHKSFINVDFSKFPTGSDISDISMNFNKVRIVRDAISNALASRGVLLESDATLYSMVAKIDDISSETVYRMDPLDVTVSPHALDMSTVTINEYDPAKSYYITQYTTFNPDYEHDSSWKLMESETTNEYATAHSTFTVTDGEKIFFSTSAVKGKVNPDEIAIEFDYGEFENSTKLTVSSELSYEHAYYGSNPPSDIYQSMRYYGSEDNYEVWDKTSEILLENFTSERLYIIFTDVEDLIVGLGSGVPKLGFKVSAIYGIVSETIDDVYDKTKITIPGVLTTGDKYCYIIGNVSEIPMYNQNIASLNPYDWDGIEPISITKGKLLTFFEVDQNYKAKKYGSVVVNANERTVKTINISSAPTDTDLEAIVTIETDKLSFNKWYYKITDDTSNPKYGDDIDPDFRLVATGNQFLVRGEPGIKILVVEYNETDKIVGAGSASVNTKPAYIKILCLKAEIGTNLGYTKVTVVSPDKDPGNVYLYTKGNAPIVYGSQLRGWTQWNGIEEIAGFKENELITVAEVTSGTFEARKVGVIAANPKPIELLPLAVTSRIGSFEQYTYVLVSPNIAAEDHEYRYAFNVHEPKLYDNVSSWMLWDGVTEIFVEEDLGTSPTIVIAECTSDQLVLKTGSTVAKVRPLDKRLTTFDITLEHGSNPDTAIVNISVTPDPSRTWKYKYYYMEEVIDLNDKANYHWNCRDWIDIVDEIEYQYGKRLYVAVCNDDYTAEYMGSTIAHIIEEDEPEEP